MPQLFIPEIGTELTLAEPWSFPLHAESRNEGLFAHFGAALRYLSGSGWVGDVYHMYEITVDGKSVGYELPVTLPVGARLKVDRIYIRKGAGDFSSVTFYFSIPDPQKPKKIKKHRFWAKLADVNNIVFADPA